MGIPPSGASPATQPGLHTTSSPVIGASGNRSVSSVPGARHIPLKTSNGSDGSTGSNPKLLENRKVSFAPLSGDEGIGDDLYDSDAPDTATVLHSGRNAPPDALLRQERLLDDGYGSEYESEFEENDPSNGTFKFITPADQNLPATLADPKSKITIGNEADGSQVDPNSKITVGNEADVAEAAEVEDAAKDAQKAEKGFFKNLWAFAVKHKVSIAMVTSIAFGLALMLGATILTGGAAAPAMIALGYYISTLCFAGFMAQFLPSTQMSSGASNGKDEQNGQAGKDAKDSKDTSKVNANTNSATGTPNAAESELKSGDLFKVHVDRGKKPERNQFHIHRKEVEQIQDTKGEHDRLMGLEDFYNWVDGTLTKLAEKGELEKFKAEFSDLANENIHDDPDALKASLEGMGLSAENIKAMVTEPLETVNHPFNDQRKRMHQIDQDVGTVMAAIRPKAEQIRGWLDSLEPALPRSDSLPPDVQGKNLSLNSNDGSNLPSLSLERLREIASTDVAVHFYRRLGEYYSELMQSGSTEAKPLAGGSVRVGNDSDSGRGSDTEDEDERSPRVSSVDPISAQRIAGRVPVYEVNDPGSGASGGGVPSLDNGSEASGWDAVLDAVRGIHDPLGKLINIRTGKSGGGVPSLDNGSEASGLDAVLNATREIREPMGDLINMALTGKQDGQGVATDPSKDRDSGIDFNDESNETAPKTAVSGSESEGSTQSINRKRRAAGNRLPGEDTPFDANAFLKDKKEALRKIAEFDNKLASSGGAGDAQFWELYKETYGFDLEASENNEIRVPLTRLRAELLNGFDEFQKNPGEAFGVKEPSRRDLYASENLMKRLINATTHVSVNILKDLSKNNGGRLKGLNNGGRLKGLNASDVKQQIINELKKDELIKDLISDEESLSRELKNEVPEVLDKWVAKWHLNIPISKK